MIKKNLSQFRLFHFLSVIFLTFALIISVHLPATAQLLPGFGLSENNIRSSSNVPTFERGDLEFSPVFLDGRRIGVVDAFRQSLFSSGDKEVSRFDRASVRAEIINSRLQKILENMTRYGRERLRKKGITDVNTQEQAIREQLVINTAQKRGNWFVTAIFPKDDVPEVIYSVTAAEISKPRFGGSQPEKIAQRVAKKTRESLIIAWRERQSPHLVTMGQRALLILVGLAVVSLILAWGQNFLKNRKEQLNSLMASTYTIAFDPLKEEQSLDNLAESSEASPKTSLISIKQHLQLNSLYRTILFWTQWLLWLLGIGYLTSLFYWTRPLSNWIIGVSISNTWTPANNFSWPPIDWILTLGREATIGIPLLFLILLMMTRLTLKIGDTISLSLARAWVKSVSNKKQRHQLRTSTLSQAFRGWLRVVTYLLLGGIIAYHLHQLGAITQVVAVLLGFISFALSLAAQDLLKDLIAGLLILWEDQYAVGDVIVVNDQGGLVENITLRVTQLRNLDGELITFPNRTIEMVRNLSSEWSRVNYAIEVNYNTNVDQVLEVMNTVGQELYQDEQWREQILEAPEILGIDELSHKGILIRLIIKTLPLQQWSVAREFRRRLKNVFDEQGITVGIPQQKMYLNDGTYNNHQQQDFVLASVRK